MQPGDNLGACNRTATSGDSSVWRLRPNNTKKHDGTSDGDELGTTDGGLDTM